jgi:hypothetical protein
MRLLETMGPLDQDVIRPIRHHLADHPLLTVDRLAEAAMRQDPKYVRFHDGERKFETSFGSILSMDPGRQALRRAIDGLGSARVFVQINRLYLDPVYRPLIDAFLDEVDALLPARERGLVRRDASAFLASPASVTPFHVDHEQNVLCHLRGPKTIHVWDGRDQAVVPMRAREDFYAASTPLPFRPEVAERAQVFRLAAGDGVFMPMGSPHALQTGAGITATFSMLFNTRASIAKIETFMANYALRRFGFSPSVVGTKPVEDEVKRRAYHAFRVGKAVLRGRRVAPIGYI